MIGVLVIAYPITNKKIPVSAVARTSEGKEILLRVADTQSERELGLSHFKSLPDNQGMLFVFETSDKYAFWMKGMNFPLDIIWLKALGEDNYEVVALAENVSPNTYPQSISPSIPADAVLEVNAGAATVYNLSSEKKLWITSKN